MNYCFPTDDLNLRSVPNGDIISKINSYLNSQSIRGRAYEVLELLCHENCYNYYIRRNMDLYPLINYYLFSALFKDLKFVIEEIAATHLGLYKIKVCTIADLVDRDFNICILNNTEKTK